MLDVQSIVENENINCIYYHYITFARMSRIFLQSWSKYFEAFS